MSTTRFLPPESQILDTSPDGVNSASLLAAGLPRSVEVLLTILALIVCSPLLLLAAFAIAVTSGRPIFFRQTRVGLNGKSFRLIKFRTMRSVNAGLEVTASGDPRITALGRVLRRMKIDELPELWNVLKGEMAIVGPRPEVERYVDLNNRDWLFVLRARPGLTDPVTLRLRNEELLLGSFSGDREQFYLKVLQPYKLNGYTRYLKSRTATADLRVIYQTAIAVILPSSKPFPTLDENSRRS